ncbi:MAG TPA: toll/interleukin-1 receptor domain-containing protein [Bryobacteraceae bacterium]|nr:toll/interleukin-1 receptor domain-containing protein [Bryobacteraceae bacterium]
MFFSYKRHNATADWTRRVHELFRFWIMQEDPDVRIFFDRDSIEVGNRWPDELKNALRTSKCMVCVWSKPYFQSTWCVSEWQSFLAREKQLALGSHCLIAPLRFHDGDDFPDEARVVQWEDVEPFANTLPAFWDSQRAIGLEDVLKRFAKRVARIIQEAPPFQENWPLVEVPDLGPPRIRLARL